ncbi:hypothetical protein RDABS01_022512 [Bienertia sinuspersici]
MACGKWAGCERVEEKIEACFDEDQAGKIMKTPLSCSWPTDSVYWWPNANGIYTVKSGYWMAKLGYIKNWFNEDNELQRAGWRLIWRLDGPPKIKYFLWRLCSGSLATMGCLHARHIVSSSACQVCNSPVESIAHCIFYCKYAKENWNQSQFGELIEEVRMRSLLEIMYALSKRLKGQALPLFVSFMLSAWICRNKCMYEQVQPKAVEVARVKVNVDAYVGNDGVIGSGDVFQDHHGRIQAATVHRVAAEWRVDMAEARAALFGLQMARRLGYRKIILEGDCHYVAREEVGIGCEKIWLNPIPSNLCNLANIDLI